MVRPGRKATLPRPAPYSTALSWGFRSSEPQGLAAPQQSGTLALALKLSVPQVAGGNVLVTRGQHSGWLPRDSPPPPSACERSSAAGGNPVPTLGAGAPRGQRGARHSPLGSSQPRAGLSDSRLRLLLSQPASLFQVNDTLFSGSLCFEGEADREGRLRITIRASCRRAAEEH